MSAEIFHSCPAAVSHYIAMMTDSNGFFVPWNGHCEEFSPLLFFFCSEHRSFFCPIVMHASRVKYWHKKLTRIEGTNHYANFTYHMVVQFTVKEWLVLTNVAYVRFYLHNTIPAVSRHSSAILWLRTWLCVVSMWLDRAKLQKCDPICTNLHQL